MNGAAHSPPPPAASGGFNFSGVPQSFNFNAAGPAAPAPGASGPVFQFGAAAGGRGSAAVWVRGAGRDGRPRGRDKGNTIRSMCRPIRTWREGR